MQDDVFVFRPLSHFLVHHVLPDLDRRVALGAIAQSALPIEVRAFRVFPKREAGANVSTVVELNDEVQLCIQAKSTRPIAKGGAVTLADIEPDECFIEPPMDAGKQSAYALYLRAFLDHRFFFDFLPNAPDPRPEAEAPFRVKFPLAEIARTVQFNQTVHVGEQLKALVSANWPPAPGYYPTVVACLHSDRSAVGTDDFVDVVAAAYGREYWNKRLRFWKQTASYQDRLPYLETAVNRYFEGDFISSTYVIVPQFEGIIKTYLQSCNITPESSFGKCAAQMEHLLLSRKATLFPRLVVDAIFNYLKDGTFWKSSNQIADPSSVVNRHGLLHGAFTGFESKRISLKYLILLDGLDFLLVHDRILTGNL